MTLLQRLRAGQNYNFFMQEKQLSAPVCQKLLMRSLIMVRQLVKFVKIFPFSSDLQFSIRIRTRADHKLSPHAGCDWIILSELACWLAQFPRAFLTSYPDLLLRSTSNCLWVTEQRLQLISLRWKRTTVYVSLFLHSPLSASALPPSRTGIGGGGRRRIGHRCKLLLVDERDHFHLQWRIIMLWPNLIYIISKPILASFLVRENKEGGQVCACGGGGETVREEKTRKGSSGGVLP